MIATTSALIKAGQLPLLGRIYSTSNIPTRDVIAVYSTTPPSRQEPLTNSGGFELGDMVTQGTHYGVVTKLDNSYRPVTITWDIVKGETQPFSFAYTLDEIQVLNISRVPKYVANETLVELPHSTTIQLTSGERVQFRTSAYFLVNFVNKEQISIKNLEEQYVFPLFLFPGRPFACILHLKEPVKLQSANSLSRIDLKIKFRTWLAIAAPDNFLELITTHSEWQQQLKAEFTTKLVGEKYDPVDLDAAWEEAWQSQLAHSAKDCGLYGLKIGDQVLRRSGEDYLEIEMLGIVVGFNFDSHQLFQIQWESEPSLSYSQLELKQLGVTKIQPITQLSANVAYQISDDGTYYRAWIGFRTKALAKAWMRPVKRLVGYLGHLVECYCPQLQHTGKKYEYWVEKPRHKTLKKRLEYLQKVAELDLEKMPTD